MKELPNAGRPLLDALAALRDVPPPVGEAEHEAQRRARIAARISATQSALVQRTRRRRSLGVWLAAALSLASTVTLWLAPSRAPREALAPTGALQAAHLGLAALERAPLPEGLSLDVQLETAELGAAGLELLSGDLEVAAEFAVAGSPQTWTATERSRVRLPGRVELELEPRTSLRMAQKPGDPSVDEVEVLRGRVQVISQAPSNGKVAVRTETVRVEARGARFSVSYVGRDTRVEVDEGTVELARAGSSRKLGAGDRWTEASPGAATRVEAAPAATLDGAPTELASAPVAELPASGSLADENRMFQAAMLAKQRGLGSLALRRLDEMLQSHPAGPLSENARVERFRILSRSGNVERARLAARAYLKRHPSGFARAEAEQLLGAP